MLFFVKESCHLILLKVCRGAEWGHVNIKKDQLNDLLAENRKKTYYLETMILKKCGGGHNWPLTFTSRSID